MKAHERHLLVLVEETENAVFHRELIKEVINCIYEIKEVGFKYDSVTKVFNWLYEEKYDDVVTYCSSFLYSNAKDGNEECDQMHAVMSLADYANSKATGDDSDYDSEEEQWEAEDNALINNIDNVIGYLALLFKAKVKQVDDKDYELELLYNSIDSLLGSYPA